MVWLPIREFSHGIESVSFFLATKSLFVIGNGTGPIVDGGSLAPPYIPDIAEITEFADPNWCFPPSTVELKP